MKVDVSLSVYVCVLSPSSFLSSVELTGRQSSLGKSGDLGLHLASTYADLYFMANGWHPGGFGCCLHISVFIL